jgi:hypothetical protein
VAKSFEFKLNREGIRKILRSPEMEAELLRRAQRVANATNLQDGEPDLEIDSSIGKNRARATVFRPGGLLREADDRALGSAIDAARD